MTKPVPRTGLCSKNWSGRQDARPLFPTTEAPGKPRVGPRRNRRVNGYVSQRGMRDKSLWPLRPRCLIADHPGNASPATVPYGGVLSGHCQHLVLHFDPLRMIEKTDTLRVKGSRSMLEGHSPAESAANRHQKNTIQKTDSPSDTLSKRQSGLRMIEETDSQRVLTADRV